MGRAARLKGKTLDERIAYARNLNLQIQHRAEELAQERALQELQGIKTMVWWQIELTIERMEIIEREASRRHMKAMELTSLMAMFGAYSFIDTGRLR